MSLKTSRAGSCSQSSWHSRLLYIHSNQSRSASRHRTYQV